MTFVTVLLMLTLLGIAVYAAWQIWTTTLDMLEKVMWWALMVMSLIASCYMLYKWIKKMRRVKRVKRMKRPSYRFLGKRKQYEMPPQVLYVCATNETARAEIPKYQHQIHHILDVEEYDSKFVGDQVDEKTDRSCISRIESPDIISSCGYAPHSFDAVVFENCPILLEENEEVHPSQRSVLRYAQTLDNVHELLKHQGCLIIPMAARPNRESATQRVVDRCEEQGFTLHDILMSNRKVGGWNMYVFKERVE